MRRDWYLAVPVIGPVLLAAAGNANFMFDHPGWIDSFGMLGRFWHYSEQNPLFEAYQGSRLPWILPGYALHRMFDEVVASYILHTAVLICSSVAVYLLLRETLKDRSMAAVVSVAWAGCTWVHGNGGWNYHVVAASTYYLWSLWMLARAATSPRPGPWLGGAGAAFACAVHAHIAFAAFAPLAALLYLPALAADSGRVTRIVAGAACAAAGALAITAAFALINAAAGGRWSFFLPQIEYVLYLRRAGNRWTQAPSEWIPLAYHLVIPCLVVLGGVLWLARDLAARSRRHTEVSPADADHARSSAFARILAGQGVLAFALMSYFQFVSGQTSLDYPYMAMPLYCHVVPMIGTLVTPSSPQHRRRVSLTLAGTAAIIAPLLLGVPMQLPEFMSATARVLRLQDLPIVALPLALGAAGLALTCVVRARARLVTFAVVYGLLNAWVAAVPGAYGIGTPGVNRDILVILRSLDRYTTAIDPSLFAIRFWGEPGTVPGFHGPVQLADVFRAFMATRRRSLVSAAYDRLGIRSDELAPEDLYSSHCLGILSSGASHDAVVARITRRFEAIGAPLRAVGRHETGSGPISVALTVLTLRPAGDPRPGLLPCPPAP